MRGEAKTYHIGRQSFALLDKHVNRLVALVAHSPASGKHKISLSALISAPTSTHFSRSTKQIDMAGMTLPAKSSFSYTSAVAMRAISPAILA